MDKPVDKQANDNPAKWFAENLVSPVYDVIVVENANAGRQAINNLARPFCHKDLIEDRIESSRRTNPELLSGNWWVQNVSSGLAGAAVYTVAGKLAGGALRFLQGTGQKAGIRLLTSDLGLRFRPFTDSIGKGGNLIGRFMVNEKVAQITGAALYDGLKETREGETSFGNMAGGAASFAVYEVGNAVIGNKYKVASSLSLVGKAKVELEKAAWRIIPGAVGSTAQIFASRAVSGDKSTLDENMVAQSLVTGAAMNAVLPWVQHGIGKSIDAMAVSSNKTIPFQRYALSIKSPLLRELSNSNPEARVKVTSLATKAEGQQSRIHLAKEATEAEQAHELWHVAAKKNLDRVKHLKDINGLIAGGKITEARQNYIDLRIREEVLANKIQTVIMSGRNDLSLHDVVRQNITETDPLWRKIASDTNYRQQFVLDFEALRSNMRLPLQETDFIFDKNSALKVTELESMSRLSKADSYSALSQLKPSDEWIAFRIWKEQRSLTERKPITADRIEEAAQDFQSNPKLQQQLIDIGDYLRTVPDSMKQKHQLLAAAFVSDGITTREAAARAVSILRKLQDMDNPSLARVAKLADWTDSDKLSVLQLQQLYQAAPLYKATDAVALKRLSSCLRAWQIDREFPEGIAVRIGDMPRWKQVAAKLAWTDALANGDADKHAVVSNFWKILSKRTVGQDRVKETFIEAHKRYGQDYANCLLGSNSFAQLQGLNRFLAANRGESVHRLNLLAQHWRLVTEDIRQLPFDNLWQAVDALTSINSLPVTERSNAWHRAASTFGMSQKDALCDSIPVLSVSDRATAMQYAVRHFPSWQLKHIMSKIALEDIPSVAKATLACPDRAVKEDLLLGAFHRLSGENTGLSRPSLLQNLFQSVADAPESDLKIIRKWIQWLPAGEHSRVKLSDDLDPTYLSRLVFGDNAKYRSVALRAAEENPNIVRVIFKNIDGYENAQQQRHAILTLAEWQKSRSLRQTIHRSISNVPNIKDAAARPIAADVIAELSTMADLSDNKRSMDALLQESLREVSESSKQQIVFAIATAARVGAKNPQLFREGYATHVESILADDHSNPSWRTFVVNQIAGLERRGLLVEGAIRLPDLKKQPIYNLSAEESNSLRMVSELALEQSSNLSRLLGDGQLGRLFPNIFGFANDGGIVGRKVDGRTEALDVKTLRVLDHIIQHPQYSQLSSKDRLNLLWAGLFHSVAVPNSGNKIGCDHLAANLSWGPLRTLGYSAIRARRIGNLLRRYSELGVLNDANIASSSRTHKGVDDLAKHYSHSAAMTQVAILNNAIAKAENGSSSLIVQPSTLVRARADRLSMHSMPILTSELPKQFGVVPIHGDYALLAHVTPNLENWFMKQIPAIESENCSISTSLITPQCQQLIDNNISLLPIVSGPFEQISQSHPRLPYTGFEQDWNGHIELSQAWARSVESREFAQGVDAKLRSLGFGKSGTTQLSALDHVRRLLSQYDSIDELYSSENVDSPLIKAHQEIIRAHITDLNGDSLTTNNEVKLNNPIVDGLAVLRKGRPIVLADAQQTFSHGSWLGVGSKPVWFITGSHVPLDAITIPKGVWQELMKRHLPLLVLDP